MNTKIYKLIDPRTNDIKYIGKTKYPLIKRLLEHLSESYHRKRLFDAKQKWISELLELNIFPIIELIEICKEEDSKERESYWVSFYKDKFMLLNIMFNTHKENSERLSLLKSIPIYQFDKDGFFIKVWKSLTEAANYYNLELSNISAAANGKRNLCGDFQWKFEHEVICKEGEILNINKFKVKKSTKKVYQYDLEGNFIKEFISGRACEEEGFNFKVISKACLGLVHTYKKFRFSFIKFDKLDKLSEKRLKYIYSKR